MSRLTTGNFTREGDGNRMKTGSFGIARILLPLLAACLGVAIALAEHTTVPPGDMMRSYQDVLMGKRSYLRCNHYDAIRRETYMQGDILEWYGFEFESPLRFVAFTVTDLDADGSPELVLRLSEDFGFELLRYGKGQVYGFPFVYRAMEELTASGEIHGSNGADDFGWYQVRFDDGKMETIELCWKHAEENDQHRYCIGDETVSESEFTEFCNGLRSKDRPIWEEYTPELLEAAVSVY